MNPDNRNIPHVRDHGRHWRNCLYVYPVIARRSRGLSIGVNLNPDKRCNFSCAYCQVDRHIRRDMHDVDLEALRRELQLAVDEAASGMIWQEEWFSTTPLELRRINDIAFSGDGEPTCLANFDKAVQVAADIRRTRGQMQVKLVVITNATQFDQPQLLKALPILDANNGEIWAKLDAGTDEYFQRVNRPHPRVALEQIVAGITSIARGRPIVIQTLFLKLAGQGPSPREVQEYCGQLRKILRDGGQIKLVQVHTIARSPAGRTASALSDAELDAIGEQVRAAVTPVPVETFYGNDAKPQENGRES